MDEVWVATTWSAHGEDSGVHGVFDSREAAFESLKALPNMTAYTDSAGNVRGRPKKERDWSLGLRQGWIPEKWAIAEPVKVQGRATVATPAPPAAAPAPGQVPAR